MAMLHATPTFGWVRAGLELHGIMTRHGNQSATLPWGRRGACCLDLGRKVFPNAPESSLAFIGTQGVADEPRVGVPILRVIP